MGITAYRTLKQISDVVFNARPASMRMILKTLKRRDQETRKTKSRIKPIKSASGWRVGDPTMGFFDLIWVGFELGFGIRSKIKQILSLHL